jgi:hypothetical protein
MKIDKQMTEFLKDCDSYYIIAVKGNSNIAHFESNIVDKNDQITSIIGGLLGKLKEFMIDRKFNSNIVLAGFVKSAQKMFPEL